MFHLGQVPDAAIVEVTFQFSEVTDVHWFVCVYFDWSLFEICAFQEIWKEQIQQTYVFQREPTDFEGPLQICKVPYKFTLQNCKGPEKKLYKFENKFVRALTKNLTRFVRGV